MEKQFFPCPLICGDRLEIRESKKGKPYIVCNTCGLQMFVRTEDGIRRFKKLIAEAAAKNLWEQIEEMKQRYVKQCPKCGSKFWVREELIETGMFDGRFVGYRCPEEDCGETVKPEGK